MGLHSAGVNIPNLVGTTATITTINSTVNNSQIYTSNAGGYQANGTSGQTSAFVSGQVKTVSGAAFTANQTNTLGAVGTLTITNGGSGYTPGTYSSIAATNITGSGSGLFISITVNGTGVVSAIFINPSAPGTGYVAGSTISSTVIPGSGTGFQATIATLANRVFTAFRETSTFTSTSGDNYYGANFTPIINQTGTANGNVYGFYWNPTLSSLLGTHNAIHTVTGNVLLATTSGNVGIGTTDTKGYKLAVAGSAVAERLVVKKQSSWPDYVFDSSYQLASLYQVERYIQQNKHLPDVPSAAEVKKEGLDLGNNQAVLLKKIEELTLYIIEQNKRVENQKQQLEIQKQTNATLENRLSEIERRLSTQNQ
jgi:hypothetical protein